MDLYTDGSTWPNPGPGGWAVVEIVDGELHLIRYHHHPHTTNNAMEGAAILAALAYLDRQGRVAVEATIWTDSRYWTNILTQWAPKWEAKGWKGPKANVPLVKAAWAVYKRLPRVTVQWVRGHSGDRGNHAADFYAGRAREQDPSLPPLENWNP